MLKLSIITVNLNNREGLERTVASVISQKFRDFEFIIVDGSSGDGSVEIIKKLDPGSFPSFKWISEKDSGVYEAMNKGIRLSAGEYLLFLNSGDFLVSDGVLEEVFSLPQEADFLLGRCNISEKGKVIHTTTPPVKFTFRYLYNSGLAHQATFIKRNLFLLYGFYCENYRYNADVEFWYRTMILEGCATKSLTTVISDYNTDGISQKEQGTEKFKKELELVFSHPRLQLFIPDYQLWMDEKERMIPLYWASSKKYLWKIIECFYLTAKVWNKMKK